MCRLWRATPMTRLATPRGDVSTPPAICAACWKRCRRNMGVSGEIAPVIKKGIFMASTLETIQAQRIVAIVRLEYYDWAVSVAQALLDGGISVIEFTLTGSGVHRAITDVRRELGGRLRVGVGTVLSPTEAESAIEVGAEFVVTPVVQP